MSTDVDEFELKETRVRRALNLFGIHLTRSSRSQMLSRLKLPLNLGASRLLMTPLEEFRTIPPQTGAPLCAKLSDMRGLQPDMLKFFTLPAEGQTVSPQPRDSMIKMVLPFATCHRLRALYQLFNTSRLRIGKLMEDLDVLAADIAYRHTSHLFGGDIEKTIANVTIVTLGLDRCNFFQGLNIESDLVVQGAVTWVGSSSLEVTLSLYSAADGDSSKPVDPQLKLGDAIFLMVARDKAAYQALPVPRLSIVSEEDRLNYEAGEERRHRRREQAKPVIATTEEMRFMHGLQQRRAVTGFRTVKSTCASNILVMQVG